MTDRAKRAEVIADWLESAEWFKTDTNEFVVIDAIWKLADLLGEVDEQDKLLQTLEAAIMAHRDQHRIYGNTSTCSGGVGGSAMTSHCAVTCPYPERHQTENDNWYAVETAYFRRKSGDPDWFTHIEGSSNE